VSPTVADEITFRNKNPGRVRAFRAGPLNEFEWINHRLLLLRDSDGFAERGLNLSLLITNCCQKHTVEPVQFGAPPALLKSFHQCFRLAYCLEGFRGTTRKVQGLSL